jgi:NAD(P)-dependent dehydrogenase (short-subunit alcohol dehydrogenase family)
MTAATLHGKHVLVTGGGTGIGLGCARRLVADGAVVTIAGRRLDVLDAAAQELRSVAAPGAEVRVAACDVTDESEVEAAVAVAVDSFGALHGAVANAGKGAGLPILMMHADQLRDTFEPNVIGAFNTIKRAGLVMRDHGGGSIVAVSSIAGKLGGRFRASYAASKAALDMLVKVSADELGPFGIRVNSVNPGLVPTPATAAITEDEDDTTVREDYLNQMPIRRLGTVEDVGGFVRFLLSEDAGWITGQALSIDGGHTIRRAPNLEHALRARMGDDTLDRLAGPRWP